MTNKSRKSQRDLGIIQKKDKNGNLHWYARISRTDGTGNKKQYTAKAENKNHAKRLRDELIEKYDNYGERALDGNKLLFRELSDSYRQRKLISARYVQNRKVAGLRSVETPLGQLKILNEHFGASRIKDITPAGIEKFKNKRLDEPIKYTNKSGEEVVRPRAIASVNRELALLRAIFNDAVQNGLLMRSPFSGIKGIISMADEVRRERVLSFEEEGKLLSACFNRRSHLKAIVITALDTAMRRGELLKLKWENVNFTTRTIHVIAMNTKTARPRSIGITTRVLKELEELWEKSPKDLEEFVFGIINTVKKSFTSACKIANIKDFRFHDLRHTAITRMIQAGLAPMEIMKISGHTQMTTFARYVNPDTNAVQRIAERLSAYQAESMIKADTSSQMEN